MAMIETLSQFAQALEPLSKFPWAQFLIAVLTWRAVRLIVFSVPRAEFQREVERLEAAAERESQLMQREYKRLENFCLIRIARLNLKVSQLEGK